jgi:hypothetical protein
LRGMTTPMLAVILLLAPEYHARAEFQLAASAHGLYSHLGEEVGAAADLALSFAWLPISEVAVGLEGALTFPLHTGQETRETDLVLRVNPAVWLIYGDEQAWGYLKAGAGMDSHLRGGSLEPVLALVGAAGFVVAPRELVLHFGFEVSGELDIAGDLPTRSIGVGGIVGWRF